MADVGFTTTAKLDAKLQLLLAGNHVVDTTTSARRLAQAYNIILSRLIERGLAKASIDTWLRGEEFQLDIATYWYGCDKGWLRQQRDEKDWLSVFNREEELTTVPLVKTDFTSISTDDVVAVVWDLEGD